MTTTMLPQRHDRSTLTIDRDADVIVKRFTAPRAFEREVHAYRACPWACPPLLELGHRRMVLPLLVTAAEDPSWRPVEETRDLLDRVHAAGWHHRDVHAKNLVKMPDGTPRLIDWETAIIAPECPSYDLVGPEASGIAKPTEHAGYSAQWWGAPTRFSLERWWDL